MAELRIPGKADAFLRGTGLMQNPESADDVEIRDHYLAGEYVRAGRGHYWTVEVASDNPLIEWLDFMVYCYVLDDDAAERRAIHTLGERLAQI